MIEIRGDYGPISEWADINAAFVRVLDNEATYATIVEAMKIATTAEFGMFADAEALARPQQLNHVYEWGELGKVEGRLWNYIVTGPKGVKTMDYVFLPSVRPVPVGIMAKNRIPKDTRNPIYVFSWKAAVEEEGRMITIRPKTPGGVLAYPTDQTWTPYSTTPTTMSFSKAPINAMVGQATQGQFEHLWETFWESGAGTKIVIEDIVDPTEAQLPIDFANLYSGISKSNPTTVKGVKSFTIGTLARRDHSPRVNTLISKLVNSYLQKAKMREALSGATSLSD